MGGGLMMDNLMPFDIYEPTTTAPARARNGGYSSWPRSPAAAAAVDPSLIREPQYYGGNRYVRPQQWNDRSASDIASPFADVRSARQQARESPVQDSDRRTRSSNSSSSPAAVRKVRTIPVQDGNTIRRDEQQTSSPSSQHHQQQKETVRPREQEPDKDGSEKDRSASRVVDAITAATVLQCVYRGYAVRRTQPLKHLRVISKVRSELQELRRRAAEPAQLDKLRTDEQERLRWNEVIMALLLRLDSIQGAHPAVRDMRKSVAKEVVRFQEIVDTAAADDVAGFVPQPSEAPAASDEKDLPETANLYSHRTEEMESRAADIVESGADIVESGADIAQSGADIAESGADIVVANSDENLVAACAEVCSGGDDASSQEGLVMMKDSPAADGEPSSLAVAHTAMDLQSDSGDHQDATDAHSVDAELADAGKLQVEASDGDGFTELEEAGANVETLNVEQEDFPVVVARRIEEHGGVAPMLAEGEEEMPAAAAASKFLVSAEEMELEKRDEEPSGVAEEGKVHDDGMHGSTSAPVILDPEQQAPNGAVMPEACGSSGRGDAEMVAVDSGNAPCEFTSAKERCNHEQKNATELLLNGQNKMSGAEERCNHEQKDATELLLNGENKMSGAAEEETDHGNRELVSSVPCLWLETPQVSSRHRDDFDYLIPGALTRVAATDLSERETSAAIVSPELTTTTSLAGTTGLLSDQAMMQKLLEENWKLKAAIGEVLQWGKQQNTIIRNLATRVEQLEAKLSDSNLLTNGCCHNNNIGRKRRSKSVGMHPGYDESLSALPGEEVRRNGQCRRGNERERFYCLNDDCWPSSSTESEEFF